jgi:hypothetical protein
MNGHFDVADTARLLLRRLPSSILGVDSVIAYNQNAAVTSFYQSGSAAPLTATPPETNTVTAPSSTQASKDSASSEDSKSEKYC